MTLNLNELPRGGTCCLSKAGLAIAGTASKVKTAAPNGAGTDYAINGILYHKADTDNLFLFTGLTQTTNTTCLYLMVLDTAGAATVVQGDEVLTASLTAGTAVLHWPTPTADKCAIGAVRLVVTGAFTGATTELSDGTVTDTYYDLFTVPVAPLTS